jgi:hypothetical protein
VDEVVARKKVSSAFRTRTAKGPTTGTSTSQSAASSPKMVLEVSSEPSRKRIRYDPSAI